MRNQIFALLFLSTFIAPASFANRIAGEAELNMMNLTNSYNCLLTINDLAGNLVSSSVRTAPNNVGSVNNPPENFAFVDVVEGPTSGLYVYYGISGSKKGKAELEVLRVHGKIEDSRTPIGWYATVVNSFEPIAVFELKGTKKKVVETNDYSISLDCIKR